MKSLFEKIRKNKGQTVLFALLIIYFGFFLLTGKGPACVVRDWMGGGSELATTSVGDSAVSLPEMGVSFKTLTGEVLSPDSLHGKKVVVNFWATWCPPCRKEIPGFNSVAEAMRDDVVIIGISLDNNVDALTKYLDRSSLEYPVVYGDPGLMRYTGSIRSIPTTLFFDKEGVFKGKHVGYLSEGGLRKKLESF